MWRGHKCCKIHQQTVWSTCTLFSYNLLLKNVLLICCLTLNQQCHVILLLRVSADFYCGISKVRWFTQKMIQKLKQKVSYWLFYCMSFKENLTIIIKAYIFTMEFLPLYSHNDSSSRSKRKYAWNCVRIWGQATLLFCAGFYFTNYEKGF
jgi:hypothetical protein